MKHTYLFILTAITFFALITTACAQSHDDTPKDTSNIDTEARTQNHTTEVTHDATTQQHEEQYEDWNYTSWIDGDRKASKITPTELTDKNMTFIFLDEPENGKVVKLRVMRISAETEYFVGQHGMLSDDHRDQIFNVELEKISDGCYIGVIANRKNTNTTQMRIAKPGIDCQR